MTHADCREEALAFECLGEHLIGIVSLPPEPTSDLGLVVVVGGPQVRTGSHRQFTSLCREVAAAGVAAMRFDVRGMGDSSGELRDFTGIDADIQAAIEALQRRLPQVRRVILWGLCDGASASLMYLHAAGARGRADPRVAGLVLLNPWVRSAQTLARTRVKHYYWDRLRQGDFWRKLLTGGVALGALRDLLGNLRAATSAASPAAARTDEALSFQDRMLLGAERFDGPLLWVLSGQDYTAQEFLELAAAQPRWRALLAAARSTRCDIAAADHTFSTQADQQALFQATVQWLQSPRLAGRAAAVRSP